MKKKNSKSSKYDYLYGKADTHAILNEGDTVLDHIKVKLPKQPPINQIRGYGLAPHQQKWVREDLPPKLEQLNKKRFADVEQYWKEIEENYQYYKDELPFIEQQWKLRLEGLWLFINGKPTYLPPWHWWYLQNFQMDSETGGDYPQYRDRDKLFFTGCHYTASSTRAYFKYIIHTDKGKVYSSSRKKIEEATKKDWKIERDGYLVDLGKRTLIGMNYPKLRREGATTKTQAINLEIITRMKDANSGIQSMTEKHAQTVYEQYLLKGWRGIPFYFIPINEGLTNPATHLRMQPKGKTKADGSESELIPLYSSITPKSSTEKAFDTWKLKFYHADETGKAEEVNVHERHYIVKKTMTVGGDSNIVGFGLNTSTVEDMDKGGANFLKLCKESHWRDRDDTGQTQSGFINFFIPSDMGLEGFVDEFGNSQREKAREHIFAKRRKLEEEGKSDLLIQEIRRTPMTFSECFTFVAKNKKFDIAVINKRLQEFAFVEQNPAVVRGKLEYAGWKPITKYDIANLPTIEDIMSRKVYVRFVQTDEDWDWEFSYIPKEEANAFYFDERYGTIFPGNRGKFKFGIDMYKYAENTESGKGSLGCGAIYRNFNSSIDNPLLPPEEAYKVGKDGDTLWKTDRFSGVYFKRPDDKNEFCEQMLMAAIFHGIPAYPEINVPDVWDWFGRDRGFESYLLHRVNRSTGRVDKRPGAVTGAEITKQIWTSWAEYIKKNGMREHHLVFLEQARDIVDQMNDFDAFAAGGYALIQDQETFEEYSEPETVDMSNFVRKYKV